MSTPTSTVRGLSPRPLTALLASGLLIPALSLAPLAFGAENPGAHEHGSAALQMAVEGNRIDLMFNSPAYNLAGFEHEPRTKAEKNRLAEVRRWLENTPLVNAQGANCRIMDAAALLGGSGETPEDEHQKHADYHHDKHHGDKHYDDEHHPESDTRASHREYDVSQQLECDRIGRSQTFEAALLAEFPAIEQLTVEWVSPYGQGSTRLTPSTGRFTLGN